MSTLWVDDHERVDNGLAEHLVRRTVLSYSQPLCTSSVIEHTIIRNKNHSYKIIYNTLALYLPSRTMLTQPSIHNPSYKIFTGMACPYSHTLVSLSVKHQK